MPHQLLLNSKLEGAALLLWAVLCDQRPCETGAVILPQPTWAGLCGWPTAKYGTGVRRVRRTYKLLTEHGWVERSRLAHRRSHVHYRPLHRPTGTGALYEQLPRAVLDVLTRHPDGADLVRAYLLWRYDANCGTGKGFTTTTVNDFAARYGFKPHTVGADLNELISLGLIVSHTTTVTGVRTLRFPDQAGRQPTNPAASVGEQVLIDDLDEQVTDSSVAETTPVPNVPSAHAHGPAVMSPSDDPKCPPIFRQLLNHEENPDSGAGLIGTVTMAASTAAVPPIHGDENDDLAQLPLAEQAKKAVRRIEQSSPQLRALPPTVRGKIRQALAREWRRHADRPIGKTIEDVVTELAIAAEDGRLGHNHVLIAKQVLRRWDADRHVTPTTQAPASHPQPARQSPTGPGLAELAAEPIPTPASDSIDDLDAATRRITIWLARDVLDALYDAPDWASTTTLEHAIAAGRTRLKPQLADQHRPLLPIAAAKVRTAHRVEIAAAADWERTALLEADDELMAPAPSVDCLAVSMAHNAPKE